MKARLFARYGDDAGLDVEFGGEATIGRGKDNTVPLSSREVSQQHARVFFDAESEAYWVEDLGSLNGTRLDGETLSGRERLGQLNVLTLGATAELFFLELDRQPAAESAEQPAGDQTRIDAEAPTLPPGLTAEQAGDRTRVDAEAPTLPPGLRAEQAARPGGATRVDEAPADLPPSLAGGEGEPQRPVAARFALEIAGGEGGRFELAEGESLVGRSARARIALRNRELSRRHATLRVEGDRVWVRDEGSRNHTFVDGEEITEEVELTVGSELRFGLLQARLVAGPPGQEEPG